MRYMLYSHDSFGLGHLRRTMRIAKAIRRRDRSGQVLIVTGSPAVDAFAMPPGVDAVRLPAITKSEAGEYQARTLGSALRATVELRSGLIEAAIAGFQPNLFLVDHAAAGLGGELRPVLTGASRPPIVVYGMRDIVDAAPRVASLWQEQGVFHLLRDAYDHVLVYGDARVTTTASELGLGADVSIEHVGFVADPPLGPAQTDSRDRFIVTVGGGEDGTPIIDRFFDFVDRNPLPTPATVVRGPFGAAGRRAERARRLGIDFVDFVPGLDSMLGTALGVVAMAGYNTTVELITSGTPAFLFPRKAPRLEQWIRAERLAPHTGYRYSTPEEVTDEDLSRWIATCLGSRRRRPSPLDLRGAERAADRLVDMAFRNEYRASQEQRA